MSNKITTPHLTLMNQDSFFFGLPIGTIFTYSQGFVWGEVVLIAKNEGKMVEYNKPFTTEYKEFGCFSGKVIGKEGKKIK